MRRLHALLWMLGLCALSACGSGGGARVGDYVGGTAAVECAPFARALTGVRLSGGGVRRRAATSVRRARRWAASWRCAAPAGCPMGMSPW